MSDTKTVLHFGAGALGKGLVMSVLHDSGCRIIAVDADPAVVDSLRQQGGYKLLVGDGHTLNARQIPVDEALLLGRDDARITQCMAGVDTVTTAVRRENLHVVAEQVYAAWKDAKTQKYVICCENIEHVSDVFKGVLAACSPDGQSLDHVCVPDTIVDRGCGYDPNDRMTVMTEAFYEISVDARILPDTGIKLIPSTDDIDRDFWRKRFLVNTCADLTAYFAMQWGLVGFGDAVHNEKLQQYLAPYFRLLQVALQAEYNMSDAEFDRWTDFYAQRRSGADNNTRPLDTIARGIWAKLDYSERIVYPLVLCLRNSKNIDAGLDLIADIMKAEMKQGLDRQEVEVRCQNMWCVDEIGREIYQGVFGQL